MKKIYFNSNIITINDKESRIYVVLIENGRIIKD